jgi:hypothetical protein
MPSCHRFLMPLTVKQFLPAVLLRIFPIQNLEPSAVLSLCDVIAKFLLGNDTLQIRAGILSNIGANLFAVTSI